MPRRQRIPSYRLHKPKNLAVVRIAGHDYYLGKFGSPESRKRYVCLISEHFGEAAAVEAGRPAKHITISELALAYLKHAENYYSKNGEPTGHIGKVKAALRAIRKAYGQTLAAEFGPLALQAVRGNLIRARLARTYINSLVDIVRQAFRWGASQEMVPSSVYQSLTTVKGLRKGRTEARETEPIPPVADDVVDATLPHLPPVVADMVRFQRLTGCRPGEACIVRPCDVDTDGDVWVYWPESHKTEHLGRRRTVFIGPKAQDILRQYLLRPSENFCFSPRERNRRVSQRFGERYTTHSYRRAIERVCDRKSLPPWRPNQLRHTRGSEVRRDYGLEAAQVTLGHSRADVTQIYAERDLAKAREVARQTG